LRFENSWLCSRVGLKTILNLTPISTTTTKNFQNQEDIGLDINVGEVLGHKNLSSNDYLVVEAFQLALGSY
jgi:hypothetical protein